MKRILMVSAAFVLLVLCMTGCGGIKAEKMIEESPFLVGEWKSDYIADEPLVTLNDDGTCVYKGVSGTWVGDKKGSTANNPKINIKLETKEKYSLRWVPHHGALEEPLGYMIEEYDNKGNDLSPNHWLLYQTTDKRMDVLTEFPWLVGNWSVGPEEEAQIILREDGTCDFFGKETKWGISYQDYVSMTSPEEHFATVLIQGENNGKMVFAFSYCGNEDWSYQANYHNISFLYTEDCQFNESVMPGHEWYNLDQLTAVEITPENILDYFEPYERVDWNKDEFGTVADARIASYLRLKDEYQPQVVAALNDIAIEFKLDNSKYMLKMKENETEYSRFKLGDADPSTKVQEGLVQSFYKPGEQEEWEFFYGVGIDSENHRLDETSCRHTMCDEWEILRAGGTLYLYNP